MEMRRPTYFVLAALLDGPLHGYAIIKRAAEVSRRRGATQHRNAVRRAGPSRRFRSRRGREEEKVEGRVRRSYTLTHDGHAALAAEAGRFGKPRAVWSESREGGRLMRGLLAVACRAFPPDHRARHSDEIVDTALLAANGSRWRTAGEALSLVVAGARQRLRAESSRSMRDGAALLAGILALVNLAVALAGITAGAERTSVLHFRISSGRATSRTSSTGGRRLRPGRSRDRPRTGAWRPPTRSRLGVREPRPRRYDASSSRTATRTTGAATSTSSRTRRPRASRWAPVVGGSRGAGARHAAARPHRLPLTRLPLALVAAVALVELARGRGARSSSCAGRWPRCILLGVALGTARATARGARARRRMRRAAPSVVGYLDRATSSTIPS